MKNWAWMIGITLYFLWFKKILMFLKRRLTMIRQIIVSSIAIALFLCSGFASAAGAEGSGDL